MLYVLVLQDVTDAGRKLAMNVIEHCAAKLEPAVKQFLISSMTGENSVNCEIDYHDVIYNLYCCSPQILLGVVPYLTGELLVTSKIMACIFYFISLTALLHEF